MASTLSLDPMAWDLTVDAHGNIATVSGIQQLAQDAASACRLFLGELWFDTSQGVPYWQQFLGVLPPQSLVTAKLTAAALGVPGVNKASITITTFTARTVRGYVTVTGTAANGQTQTATVAF